MGEALLNDQGLRGSSDRQVCVLVVEDDPALQRMIVNYFVENSIRTLVASGRREMVQQLSSNEVSLVILDLRLGQEDGLDLLREVRSNSDVPVIIITGHRRDDVDRVVGLELGADDYLTKPFNLRELLARVRAVLRRFDIGRVAPGARARPLSIFRLAARSQDSEANRSERRSGPLDQRRVRAVARLSRCPATPAQSRAPAAGHTRSRGCLRSQHRCANSSPPAQARRRPQRAARHPDRARRGICVRSFGRAALTVVLADCS